MNVYEIRQRRLSQLLHEMYDNKKSALAKRLDIQASYLSRFSAKRKENRRNIGDKLARRIESVSGKTIGWMDRDVDQNDTTDMASHDSALEPARLDFIARIPVLGNTQAGRDGYWYEEADHPASAAEHIDAPSRDSSAYGLRIRGRSMWPRMREGDVLSISPVAECFPGDYVVIRTWGGETLVKELVVCRHNEVILNSLGDQEPRIALPVDSIELMHKVAAIVPGSLII